jgi:hypothetical protein
MATIETYTFKRGGTFGLAGFKTLPAGTWSAAATLQPATGAPITLDVTLTPPVDPETRHAITIRAESDVTASWPVGNLQGDIAFYDASDPPVVIPTNTFVVKVVERITDVG